MTPWAMLFNLPATAFSPARANPPASGTARTTSGHNFVPCFDLFDHLVPYNDIERARQGAGRDLIGGLLHSNALPVGEFTPIHLQLPFIFGGVVALGGCGRLWESCTSSVAGLLALPSHILSREMNPANSSGLTSDVPVTTARHCTSVPILSHRRSLSFSGALLRFLKATKNVFASDGVRLARPPVFARRDSCPHFSVGAFRSRPYTRFKNGNILILLPKLARRTHLARRSRLSPCSIPRP